MKKLTACFIGALLTALLVCGNSYAASGVEYWPNWRGPDNTGVSKTANPPVKWSETENIKWKVATPGRSLSTPIVWENKIIFLTAIEAETNEYKFDIVCMDRETGKTLWQKTAIQTTPHEGHQQTGSFASSSAVTDGKRIWAGFGSRGVYCYDIDGNPIWKKDLGKMRMLLGFGEGSSVALAGDAVIVLMDQEDQSKIYSLNKDTGDILWQKDRDEVSSWATPLPIEFEGKLQVVTCATKLIASYDVKTGDILWQCSGLTRNVIPSPVTGFGMVICTSGYQGNKMMAIELGRGGDLSNSDAIKWQTSAKTTPYVPSPLLYGERIYILANNRALLSCYNAKTGKPYYESQSIEGAGGYYASPAGASDKVYLASQNGATIVIKNADTYEVLATNKLDDQFDASPVFVENQLILKGHKSIYCIAEK